MSLIPIPTYKAISTRQLKRSLRKLYRKRMKEVNAGYPYLASNYNADINGITSELEKRGIEMSQP